MEVRVYDKEDGVIIEFDSGEGFMTSYLLNKKEAQNLINIIQNKLDGQWKDG